MNDDIIDIQERLVHQDDEISRLSDELASRGAEIDLLKKQIQLLNKKLNESILSASDKKSGVEKPPHY